MSISRASGAIPRITALQIATASFAVPKSVMKTIVGRAAVPVAPAAPFPAGDLPHAQHRSPTAKARTAKNRTRAAIKSPKIKGRHAKLLNVVLVSPEQIDRDPQRPQASSRHYAGRLKLHAHRRFHTSSSSAGASKYTRSPNSPALAPSGTTGTLARFSGPI